MAKEATNPKPRMQREWYCLAVHKNTREYAVEYAGAEKQTTIKSPTLVATQIVVVYTQGSY